MGEKMAVSIFEKCGSIAEQLLNDIETMGIPEEYVKPDHPVIYYYENNRYFVKEQAERSNEWVSLFESEDGEEFRFYVLKEIASRWGQKCAMDRADDLKSKWNAEAYGCPYDWRIAWWESEIEHLAKVYEFTEELMQREIFSCESLLGIWIVNGKKMQWKYDTKTGTFGMIRMKKRLKWGWIALIVIAILILGCVGIFAYERAHVEFYEEELI